MNSRIPADWPFNGDALAGALGPLLDPGRSIFFTDPLILLTIAVAALRWRHLAPVQRDLTVATLAGLAVTTVLLARLEFWHAAPAWGARYHQPSAVLIAMLGVPLALRYGGRALRSAVPVIAAAVFAWQVCATAVDHKVEEVQRGCGARSQTLVAQRIANVGRVLRHRPLLEGACALPMQPELSRITFLPFRAGPELPAPARHLVFAAWLALVLVLAISLAKLLPALRPSAPR